MSQEQTRHVLKYALSKSIRDSIPYNSGRTFDGISIGSWVQVNGAVVAWVYPTCV